ncbi:MAG TPA: hypothetical protein VN455_04625 [Methanotrichaceae archaeon]|nr:hypothetical protein [Methanotrichaceae archaeon]
MHNEIWKIYYGTDEDYIEYSRCKEMLHGAGLTMEEIDMQVLNCSVCILSGRCSVIRDGLFLGAKTC